MVTTKQVQKVITGLRKFLTLEEIEKKTGAAVRTLIRWEQGHHEPRGGRGRQFHERALPVLERLKVREAAKKARAKEQAEAKRQTKRAARAEVRS